MLRRRRKKQLKQIKEKNGHIIPKAKEDNHIAKILTREMKTNEKRTLDSKKLLYEIRSKPIFVLVG